MDSDVLPGILMLLLAWVGLACIPLSVYFFVVKRHLSAWWKWGSVALFLGSVSILPITLPLALVSIMLFSGMDFA